MYDTEPECLLSRLLVLFEIKSNQNQIRIIIRMIIRMIIHPQHHPIDHPNDNPNGPAKPIRGLFLMFQ